MYLDYAEDQALSRKPMHMSDWIKKLDGFLHFNERNILLHAGKISHQMALDHAEKNLTNLRKSAELLKQVNPRVTLISLPNSSRSPKKQNEVIPIFFNFANEEPGRSKSEAGRKYEQKK